MKKILLSRSGITRIQATILTVIIIVVVVAGAAAYWYVSQPTGGPESIILGADAGFSGPLATLNAEFRNGWELAISEYNAEGGVYVSEYGRKLPIDLSYVLDNKGDPTTAVSNVERLCTTYNVDFVLGGCGTSVIRGSAPVADRNNKIYINGGTAYLPLHQEGYDYVFTTFISVRGLVKPYMDFLQDAPLDPEPQVLAHWHDDGWLGKELDQWVESLCPIQYTEREFPMGITDFTVAIAEAKAADPPIDVLVMSFQFFTDSTTLWYQLQELDWAPKLIMSTCLTSPPITQASWGETLYDRMLFLDVPQTIELYELFDVVIERYNPAYDPGTYTFWSYVSLKSLILAIEHAGSLDTDKVADALYDLEWETPCGLTINFEDRTEEYPGYGDLVEPVVKFVPPFTIHGKWTCYDKAVWPLTAGVPGWEVVDYVYPMPGW